MTRMAIGGIANLCLATLLLGACGSSPPERFYTLNADAPANGARSAKLAGATSIVVGPVTLPELVDRPQFVVRVAPNRVAILEQQRWAEPLKNEIARVVAANLGQLLNGAQVLSYPANASGDAVYRVAIDVQRFDSIPGDGVIIDSSWTVRRPSGGTARTGHSTLHELARGTDYDALVAAYDRALASLSGEIAQSILQFDTAAR
jgi:uncharacterized protein